MGKLPDKNPALLFACDLGGTKVHIALADSSGTIRAEALARTDQRGPRHLLDQIQALARSVAHQAGVDNASARLGIVGVPGVVDPSGRRLLLSPNIPDMRSIDMTAAMREAFGCRCIIENDVNLAALGEARLGRGVGVANLAFIALGTGIGMGLIVDGRLVRGAHGGASEIAYLPLGGDPFDPRNVEAGTLESVVGSAGILERYARIGAKRCDSVREVFEAAGQGDAAAIAVLDDTARWTALGIAAVAALLDPELVIMGGSIGCRPEFITGVDRHLSRCLLTPLPPARTALANRAALMGAIALGIEAIETEAP